MLLLASYPCSRSLVGGLNLKNKACMKGYTYRVQTYVPVFSNNKF
jgi:hypothetical protein